MSCGWAAALQPECQRQTVSKTQNKTKTHNSKLCERQLDKGDARWNISNVWITDTQLVGVMQIFKIPKVDTLSVLSVLDLDWDHQDGAEEDTHVLNL